MSSIINKKIAVISAIITSMIFMLIVGFAVSPHLAKAGPDDFCLDTNGIAGTSTLSFLQPGTGTTTLTLSNCGGTTGIKSLEVLGQYTASSSAPTLNARLELSQNNIDWYPEMTTPNIDVYGSTATTSLYTTPFHVYQMTLSTTTDIGGSGSSTSRVHFAFPIANIPTRYARIKFYVPAGGGNGLLYVEVVGKKEI